MFQQSFDSTQLCLRMLGKLREPRWRSFQTGEVKLPRRPSFLLSAARLPAERVLISTHQAMRKREQQKKKKGWLRVIGSNHRYSILVFFEKKFIHCQKKAVGEGSVKMEARLRSGPTEIIINVIGWLRGQCRLCIFFNMQSVYVKYLITHLLIWLQWDLWWNLVCLHWSGIFSLYK